MIKLAQIKPGSFASDLPALKGDRAFPFVEGINFLFGPNGCGKSTLLRTMAAYNFIEQKYGGWSRRPEYVPTPGVDYPDSLHEWAPGNTKAHVIWDGTASFMFDAQLIAPTMTHIEYETKDSMDGLTDLRLQMALTRMSQGQMTMEKLVRAMMVVETLETPDLKASFFGKWELERPNDKVRAFLRYMEGLPRDGKPTLFLDEPDRSLSVPIQRNLFHRILPRLAQKFQIICATQSPMAFYVENALYHDMEEGFLEDTQCTMHLYFGRDKLQKMHVLGRDWKEKVPAQETEPTSEAKVKPVTEKKKKTPRKRKA